MGSLNLPVLLTLIVGIVALGGVLGQGDLYEVGVGIGDVTGVPAGLGLMGYANPTQIGKGIHTRLFARTFIVKSGNERVVFVSVDAGMMDTSIRKRVTALLEEEFGGIYTLKNVLLSATHTHSGPGGYIQYAMYGIASLGFHRDNFETIVQGIVASIRKAHYNIQLGRISVTTGRVDGASINRSPYSYNNNPQTERDQYTDDVDKEMTLIRIDSADGMELGTFNWFAVHPTSMNNTNRFVSGDNKGFAAQQFELRKNPGFRPGKGPFVAAFATTNLGDASPNTEGPLCRGGPLTGQPCDLEQSTCGDADHADRVKYCIAFGPGRYGDNFESAEIIGGLQFDEAWRLFHLTADQYTPVSGPIQHGHQQINMNAFDFQYIDPTTGSEVSGKTCPAALGYSFAAGTIDGPGFFNFIQNELEGNEFWDRIRDFLTEPSEEQIACHSPKPILLDVGEIPFPYDWVPSVVETQIIRVGNLYILAIPGEFSTMSGRRMRNAVKARILELRPNEPEPIVIIAGLSNLYTHYIATYEEYQVQRYEGASTMYGPRTLDAYIYQYENLAEQMIQGTEILAGPNPPDLIDLQISLLKSVIVDLPPLGYAIGQVKVEPLEAYYPGETVSAIFVSGHLRNNPMREGSFLVVERLNTDEDPAVWEVVATDADWSTKIEWSRPNGRSGLDSQVEITWKTGTDILFGTYRIRHFGYYKPYMTDPVQYEGTSRTFEIGMNSKYASFKRQRYESPLVKMWKKITNFRLF